MTFNIYMAGGHAKVYNTRLQALGSNRLFTQKMERNSAKSWIDFKQETDSKLKLFLDSSAYTAHTKGIEIDVDEYLDYINANEGQYECIAQVDKIPGEYRKPKSRAELMFAPKNNWENYLYMRERINKNDIDKLLPIFHMGEDFKWLVNMLEATFENGKHIDYIGISPANDSSRFQKSKWFEHVYKIIRDSSNPNVKTHAFGMTVIAELEKFPFYSADSTAWLMAGTYGRIYTEFGDMPVSDRISGLDHLFNQDEKIIQKKRLELLEEGYDLDELRVNDVSRCIYNAEYMMKWAKDYEFKGKHQYQRRLF